MKREKQCLWEGTSQNHQPAQAGPPGVGCPDLCSILNISAETLQPLRAAHCSPEPVLVPQGLRLGLNRVLWISDMDSHVIKSDVMH